MRSRVSPYLSHQSAEEERSDPLERRFKISPAAFPRGSGSPISQKQVIICTSPDVGAHFTPKTVAASSLTELLTEPLNKDHHQVGDVMMDSKNQTVSASCVLDPSVVAILHI